MERQEYVDAALEAGDHAGFYAGFCKPYELKCVYIFQVLGNRQGDAVGSISSKAVVSLSFSPISLPNEFQITSNTTKIELNLHLEFQPSVTISRKRGIREVPSVFRVNLPEMFRVIQVIREHDFADFRQVELRTLGKVVESVVGF